MFEKRLDPLASHSIFINRLFRSIFWGSLLIAIALLVGMWGYHAFENMTWVDAFANAAMILSGMGPLTPLVSKGGKIFAGFYALFSGLTFILIISIVFAPVVHRFFHKFHLDDDEKTEKTTSKKK